MIGLYKTDLINKRGPWKTLSGVEPATAEYVDWLNARRLHTAVGDIPPNEFEAEYYGQHQPVRRSEPTTEVSIEPGEFDLS